MCIVSLSQCYLRATFYFYAHHSTEEQKQSGAEAILPRRDITFPMEKVLLSLKACHVLLLLYSYVDILYSLFGFAKGE
jgi:hypothetical protein